MIDREVIARLKELDAKATPPGWAICTDATGDTFIASMTDSAETVCEFGSGYDDEMQASLEHDAALIVALRNDALRIITQQEAEIERLMKALRDVIEYEAAIQVND